MTSTTSFKDIADVGSPLLTDQLETNLASFFQWGALGIGAFSNVSLTTAGAYGGEQSKLRVADNPNYEDGCVWEGFRKDWVWETGVEYSHQPIAVSGVYVNNTFHPSSASGAYAHHIDYVNGSVVFDSPIAKSSVVKCEYSYRTLQVATPDIPWWRRLQLESYRSDGIQFQQQGSGDWSTLAQSRIQLPAIVIEATPNVSRRPKGIGSSTAIVSQEVLFHVLAETRSDLKTWHDIVSYQWQHRITAFDKGTVSEANAFPLTADGSLASGAVMYPDLVKPVEQGGYAWRQVWFASMRSSGPFNASEPLCYATVRAVVEVDI